MSENYTQKKESCKKQSLRWRIRVNQKEKDVLLPL